MFPFELTENFEIGRIWQDGVSKRVQLQLGDKVVSIGPLRLMKPDDLLKCRGWVKPGEDIQIMIKRGGVSLRVQQSVEKQVLFKLESNRLADADKQEKLQTIIDESDPTDNEIVEYLNTNLPPHLPKHFPI